MLNSLKSHTLHKVHTLLLTEYHYISLSFFICVLQVEILFCLYHLLLSRIAFGASATLSSLESVGCSFIENKIVLIWLGVSSRPVCLFEKPSFSALLLIGIERWGGT